ncbi:MAG: RagB/SusD family nutrient uptake outer membrane protein [Mangrovibacterium sp.]
MKRSKYTVILFLLIAFSSCNEDKILEETPLDFYSPENSYTKPEHFEAAITYIYDRTRTAFYNNDVKNAYALFAGTDFQRDARNVGSFSIGDYALLTSLSGQPSYWWTKMYEIISEANVILSRIEGVEYSSESEKNAMIAEAMFFRGLAYRTLGYLFGGVPLVLEEIKSPKRDFTRATRDAVYEQVIADLKYASENLPDINSVKAQGRVSKEAASHFLAEMYLATEQWDNAINEASKVINNPNFELMKVRFGSRKNEPGDVWWDLFQMNNQNRNSGNKEAIWVAQFEVDNGPQGVGNYKAERIFGCVYWQLKDPKGVNGFIGPTTQNCGRGAGYLGPTDYFTNTIWLSDWDNDLRNNQHNMIRDFIYDNPASSYYGKKVSENPGTVFDTRYYFYPFQSKISTPGNHPDHLYIDKTTGLLSSNAMKTYHDQYFARLAETYLIRAEAYLGKGGDENKNNAANDINEVRTRVNATPVDPDDVTIDYILDERLRELAYEEPRRLTLARLGMVYERTSKYNTYDDGKTIKPHNELFPIPYSEIERNSQAKLEQNPGYDE